LSPAFDINPNPEKDAHVLAINDVEPTPDSGLWRDTAEFYRVNKKALNRIETEVRQAVAQWQQVARAQGASRGDISRIATVIDPQR
jgi:serine/threonine-protein kinase HipA